MSIEVDENNKWTGSCHSIDCIHNLAYNKEQREYLNEKHGEHYLKVGYSCHLDRIHKDENNKCLNYETKLQSLIKKIIKEMKNEELISETTEHITIEFNIKQDKNEVEYEILEETE